MTEKNWTPGPWHTAYSTCHTGEVATCHGDEEGWWEVWTPNWGSWTDQKANAHLISAAPEMYEELEGVVDLIDHDGKIDQILSLLAKARGEKGIE